MPSKKKIPSGITTYTEFQEEYRKSKGDTSTPAEYAKAWAKYKEKNGIPTRKRSILSKKKKKRSKKSRGKASRTRKSKKSSRGRTSAKKIVEDDFRDVESSRLDDEEEIIINGMIDLALKISKSEKIGYIPSEMMYEVLYNVVSKDDDKIKIINEVWEWIDSLTWHKITFHMPKFQKLINRVHKIFSKKDKRQKYQIHSSSIIASVIRWLRLDASKRIYRTILSRMQKIDNIRIRMSAKKHSYNSDISKKLIKDEKKRKKNSKKSSESSHSSHSSPEKSPLVVKPRRKPLKKRNRSLVSPKKSPSKSPSVSRSKSPSVSRSKSPSVSRSKSPSVSRSKSPSVSRSKSPSVSRSKSPSVSGSEHDSNVSDVEKPKLKKKTKINRGKTKDNTLGSKGKTKNDTKEKPNEAKRKKKQPLPTKDENNEMEDDLGPLKTRISTKKGK